MALSINDRWGEGKANASFIKDYNFRVVKAVYITCE